MKKILLLLLMLVNLICFSQESEINVRHEYDLSGKLNYDKKLDRFSVIEETVEYLKSSVSVRTESKTIIIIRDMLLSNGEPSKSFETYYYVKAERNENDSYEFYGVDLLNKKFIQFQISSNSTLIRQNCNAITGCQNLTLLSN